MANAKIIEAKKEVVQEIEALIQKSPLIIFCDYRGTKVADMAGLRNQLRMPGVKTKVYKNTMLAFALKNCGYEELSTQITGPNLVIFSETELVEPAKILNKLSQSSKTFSMKVGLLEGKIVSEAGLESLAELPSREVLVAQVLGTIQSPITSFVRVLSANITGLARVLDQIREKQAS